MNRKHFIYIYILIMDIFLCSGFTKKDKIFITKNYSNSAEYYYEITENNNSYIVKIYTKDNECVFIDDSSYRKFDRFFVCWDDIFDKLWIWSSDIGFFIIEKNDNWTKRSINLTQTPKNIIPATMIDNVPFLQKYYN